MEPIDLFLRFGAALAIGFTIGLQREFSHGGAGREIVAGERTFSLIGLSGCLAAFVADEFSSPVIFFGALLLLSILIGIAYFVESSQKGQFGLTTEFAILIAFLVGTLCYWGYFTVAVAIGIVTTVLLSLKLETDRLVQALTREDIFAALQLAVISAIVLPVLPNASLLPPPFDVLNPFKIWLMVVFISGISFLGYVLIKVRGAREGIGLTGFLGGLVSSTAVTLSFSQRSNRETNLAKPFALAITVAWTVMFLRVLVVVGVINLQLLGVVWLPIAVAGIMGLLYSIYLFLSHHADEKGKVEFNNPFDLASAIKFGILYGVILLFSRSAQMYFGDTGVYISSLVSGLADVDAVTLTVAELSNSGGLGLDIAARAIVIAVMSNTIVKGSIVLISGSVTLRKTVIPGLLLILITGIGVVLLI